MGKLVMGYWDCAFCGEKKIPGTNRACPACGKVRGADAVFYMDDEKQYLTEEEAATKGKGADWYCSFCDSLNSALDPVCKSCGATKEESEKNYFELQEKKKQDAAKREAQKIEVAQKREEIPKRKSRLPLLLIPLVLIALMIGIAMPKTKNLKITDVFWHNVIEIEKNTQLEESDWSVPPGGEVEYTRREIQSYVQVIDHYETETYTVQVQSGSHTEYTYRDNGDGSFEEIPHEVPDYTTELRTREVPVYRDEPVYGTKYYYLIWRWIPERTVETDGHDKNPVWGTVNLTENERESVRYSEYTVTGTKDDKTKEYTVSEEIWKSLNVGDSVKCKVRGNAIIEIE